MQGNASDAVASDDELGFFCGEDTCPDALKLLADGFPQSDEVELQPYAEDNDCSVEETLADGQDTDPVAMHLSAIQKLQEEASSIFVRIAQHKAELAKLQNTAAPIISAPCSEFGMLEQAMALQPVLMSPTTAERSSIPDSNVHEAIGDFFSPHAGSVKPQYSKSVQKMLKDEWAEKRAKKTGNSSSTGSGSSRKRKACSNVLSPRKK